MPTSMVQKKNMVAYVPQSEEVDWNFPECLGCGNDGSLRVYECTKIPSPTDRRIVAESLERCK